MKINPLIWIVALASATMTSYICHRYYKVINNEKVLLKHYIIKLADPTFKPSSVAIMRLSDWRNDLTFEDISKSRLNDAQENSEDVVYLDVIQETINGCIHYPLNCRVICSKCNKEYPCRICHDDDFQSQCGEIDRSSIRSMRCLLCDRVGPIGLRCSHCNGEVAKSFCPKCNYISMVSPEVKPFFHCEPCTFCRVGKYEEHKHCDICRQCYKKQFFDTHVCDPTDYVCCVCHEELKTSIYDHCEVGCGNRHYIHLKCFSSLIQSNTYTCPLCRKLFLAKSALKQLTNQYSRFFMLCLLACGYVTPVPVTADEQSNLQTNSGTSTSSSASYPENADEAEEDEQGEGDVSAHHNQNQDQVQQDDNHNNNNENNNNDNNNTNGEFFFFSEEASNAIKDLFNMDVAMFVLNIDRFIALKHDCGRCRQCSKCFWLPSLDIPISDIPCVYCGLFNVDIISSSETDAFQTEDEFVSAWRAHIEGYRLNVKKHALYIRETLNYLNNHFVQLLRVN